MKTRITLLLMLTVLIPLFFLTACGDGGPGGGPGLTGFRLDVTIKGKGQVDPPGGRYESGTPLVVKVYPQEGWEFSQWEGPNADDLVGSYNFWALVMDGNKKITVVFVPEGERTTFFLDVSIEGNGTINYVGREQDRGESVILLPEPNPGWIFTMWDGPNGRDVYLSGKDVWRIVMDSDKEIVAVFEEEGQGDVEYYTLNVTIDGQGSVSKQPNRSHYAANSHVHLTARPDPGWVFDRWLGHLVGQDFAKELLMDSNKEVIAVFTEDNTARYTLSITVWQGGSVEKIPDLPSYPAGSEVRLIAHPDPGYMLEKWLGSVTGTEPIKDLIMDEDKSITAYFTISDESPYFNLTISIEGEGSVETYPNDNAFLPGSAVRLTATPSSGWTFSHWSLDLDSTANPATVYMDGHKHVQANFAENAGGDGARISGSISMNHIWPNPYSPGEIEISRGKGLGKLQVLNYASSRLKAQFKEKYVPGELIIGFKKNYLLAEEELSILSALGLTVLEDLSPINAYLVEAPEMIDEASAQLALASMEDRLALMTSDIAYVEPNYYVYATNYVNYPNDTHLGHQWHYPQIRLPQAWALTTGSKSVRIAVLDTGISYYHPDLGDNVDTGSGWNFIANNSNTNDDEGHGSHCAGTIAANTNNNEGVAGVMWQASLIPVKVLNNEGSGSLAGVANGILYAAGLGTRPLNNPAQVISMSLGAGGGHPTLEDACDAAYDAGVIVVAASGNDNGPISYPAYYDSVICVGATDLNYPNIPQRAPYSNFGPQISVVAPGGDALVDTNQDTYFDGVLSTSFQANEPSNTGYFFFQGTSMACPHVAGLAGLMLANGVPASEIQEALERTAMDLGPLGFDNYFGHGLVNAYWAVNNVKKIKILVGSKNGNQINAVAQGTVDLKDLTYSLDGIPQGTYSVYGWVDVQNTNRIDEGDYFFASDPITFGADTHMTLDLELSEY